MCMKEGLKCLSAVLMDDMRAGDPSAKLMVMCIMSFDRVGRTQQRRCKVAGEVEIKSEGLDCGFIGGRFCSFARKERWRRRGRGGRGYDSQGTGVRVKIAMECAKTRGRD